jgi:hypothetical protein
MASPRAEILDVLVLQYNNYIDAIGLPDLSFSLYSYALRGNYFI